MLSNIAKWIAKTGQSIQFVAFWAHLGVAALLVILAARFGHAEAMGLTILIGGAIKEYGFDAHFEKDPPQTFWDNTQDFAGWFAGVVVGYVLQ